MSYSRNILLTLGLMLVAVASPAQNLSDLRIGEVLAQNDSGLIDDFGQRNGWIELFNSSNGTVKFGGCYLSDDKKDLKKYHIPTTDRSTQVAPRQSVVFYASGNASQGTYYMNFTLENGETVYLVGNDGRTIIDALTIPENLPAGCSVMQVPTGVKGLDFVTKVSENPTPGSYNGDVDAKTKNQIMKEKDPFGWVLTLISVSVVFLALTILSFIFGWVGQYNKRLSSGTTRKQLRQNKARAGEMTPEVAAAISMALLQALGGETCAAIAMALDEYCGGVHDEESFLLTIQRAPGSAWAGKGQNFRQLPRK